MATIYHAEFQGMVITDLVDEHCLSADDINIFRDEWIFELSYRFRLLRNSQEWYKKRVKRFKKCK